MDNTAAHNGARTGRKQQLLNSFSQIKISFSTKTPALHTELATFLEFGCDYDVGSVLDPIFLSNSDFSNLSNGGRFEHEFTVIFNGILFGILTLDLAQLLFG